MPMPLVVDASIYAPQRITITPAACSDASDIALFNANLFHPFIFRFERDLKNRNRTQMQNDDIVAVVVTPPRTIRNGKNEKEKLGFFGRMSRALARHIILE